MRSILFVEKVFLSCNAKLLGGVELFNLCLIKDLASLGYSVTVPAHPAWGRIINNRTEDLSVEIINLPWNTSDLPGGLLVLTTLVARRFDLLLIGNVGDRLIPIISCLRWMNTYCRIVLIAHREPKTRFIHALNRMPITVLAVNK